MHYSQIIKEERLKRKLSQSELGDKLGVSQAMIALIEEGKRGASDKLKVKFSELFNLPVEYIFFNHTNNK